MISGLSFEKIRWDVERRDTQIKTIVNFIKSVLPPITSNESVSPTIESDTQIPESAIKSEPSTDSIVFETPKRTSIECDDYNIIEEANTRDRTKYGELAGPYLTPYQFHEQFHDKQYGI